MIQISLPYIIEFITTIEGINELKPDITIGNCLHILYGTQSKIGAIFTQSVYGPNLRSSRQKANELHKAIEEIVGEFDLEKKLTDYEVWLLKTKKDEFKLVFMAELEVVPAFIITRKEGFDTLILIESGLDLFPKGLVEKAPETEKDASETGKALAFELGTACGFHAFRVTEAVARRYWDEASGGKTRPKPETLGKIASEMTDKKIGDNRIIESIKQMTRLHRNPLIHPEVILSIDEAIGILGLARSVVGAMIKTLPDVPITTGAVPAEQQAD